MQRYSAMCRQNIGNGFQSFDLKADYATRDQAMKAAIEKFGPHAEDHIIVYSFAVDEATSKGTQ